MAFSKVWLGSVDTNPNNAANWLPISVRAPAYAWTASGLGTNEYYLRTSGGSNPGLAAPGKVLLDGASASSGTIGSLAAGTWAYGDNDTLGYSTLYVRLSDGADPDSKARDYVEIQQVPVAGDSVTIAGSAVRAMAGADFSGVAINAFHIEPGFRSFGIGDRDTPLRIDPDSFVSEGSGNTPWYIDIGSATITPTIRNCPTPSNGLAGLYLTGSAMGGVVHDAGSLAIAGLIGDTSTCTEMIVRGGQARLLVGAGVTWTTLRAYSGQIVLRSNGTTVHALGGQIETQLAMTLTTLNIEGATVVDKSSGTFAAVNLDAGTYDTMQLPAAKTVSTLQHNAGQFRENVDLLAITTRDESDYAGIVERRRQSA